MDFRTEGGGRFVFHEIDLVMHVQRCRLYETEGHHR